MAIQRAEKLLDPIIHSESASEEVIEEAKEMSKQLDHSKVYYAWLSTLSEALNTGEIFEHFPIPNTHNE